MRKTIRPFLLLCLLFFVACATGPDSREIARTLTTAGIFSAQYFDTSTFVLYGLLKPAPASIVASMPTSAIASFSAIPVTTASTANKTLHVYIEGDGLAWISRSQPSSDPTPTNPTMLHMASADPYSGPVLYLARPCQYVSGTNARLCQQKYWTNARFAPEVVQSMDEAINQAKNLTNATQVSLVGYSGGGGIATLIAARRDDVSFLGSVAGNLDHKTWTEYHHVSPMTGSLNPLDVAQDVQGIPQLHLSSPTDSVIPPSISARFCKALGRMQPCKSVPGISHGGAWETIWPWETMGY